MPDPSLDVEAYLKQIESVLARWTRPENVDVFIQKHLEEIGASREELTPDQAKLLVERMVITLESLMGEFGKPMIDDLRTAYQ
jgi:hypothetical protein